MKRREFIQIGLVASVLPLTLQAFAQGGAGAGAKKLTDKDVLKDGEASAVANYCTNPEKQPNKACPGYKDKPGKCDTCMFFNKDNSLTDYKGEKHARCQLLTDPKKPQFVAAKAWCATYTALPK